MTHAIRISLLFTCFLFILAWSFAPSQQATKSSVPSKSISTQQLTAVDTACTLRVLHNGEIEEMTMDKYLLGVLRAEMPASFEPEALKAQAVAARTYTLCKMAEGSVARHPDADTCDDITCCKAYKDADTATSEWGISAFHYEEKLTHAVSETDGEIIVYNDEPVLAVFFSSAAGHTQGAGDVWNHDLPYLQSVESPENESLVPNYHTDVCFSAQEFRDLFLAAYPTAMLNDDAQSFITNLVRNEAGFVSTLCVGGVTLRGNELRTVLSLRSPTFTVDTDADSIIFHVTGYGHGVGMSQYGANAMAKSGSSYIDILEHYFTGAQVVRRGV